MNIINTIWDYVLSIFSKKAVDRRIQNNSSQYKAEYEQIQRINFTSIFATALANKAVSDSSFAVKDSAGKNSRRSEWIAKGLDKVWEKRKNEVSQALGKGGKILVPYVQNGQPFIDCIDQSRMAITAMRGDEITGAILLADIGTINSKVYYRFADYSLENGVHTIRNMATTDRGGAVELNILPQWENIEPETVIDGVEHLLFGYLKSPTDSREDKQIMGVPITYGTEETVNDLHTCLADIRREYSMKKSFVGADDRMFGKNNKLPENGLFKLFKQSGLKDADFFYVFDPAIRDSSYLTRFQHLCGLLESSVGVSPGILTEPRTANATATEIRAANAATFAMVDSIRKNIEKAFEQTAYALDVLAEFYGATPTGAMGDWQILWDWDMSMMESSSETFDQLSELESRGGCSLARLNSYVTGQSLEEAQNEIDLVNKEKAKTASELLPEMLEPRG